MRLQDLALDERTSIYAPPNGGDWLWLGLLALVLLGNGVYVWHQLGFTNHVGRAVFFGLLLLALYWGALIYTFKLSVAVWVGPQGLSVVRGPWRTELSWADIGRLTERTLASNGRRYRWVVALARDGRFLHIREDLVGDYPHFRLEVYERYRLWSDHGGTWGTTGGGPFSATETVSGELRWWSIGGVALALPGVYLALLLPEAGLAGPALMAVALLCGVLGLRARLRRQTYTVDSKAVQVKGAFRRPMRLMWNEIARVERTRHAFSGVIRVAIVVGRGLLALVARTDTRIASFAWSPRVPEYLMLRGGGRQVRVRLHRVANPDELLAWVEFYERMARRRRTAAPATEPVRREPVPTPLVEDLSSTTGPNDPWGAGRAGALPGDEVAAPTPTPSAETTGAGGEAAQLGIADVLASLRAEPGSGAPASASSSPPAYSGGEQHASAAPDPDDAWLSATSPHPVPGFHRPPAPTPPPMHHEADATPWGAGSPTFEPSRPEPAPPAEQPIQHWAPPVGPSDEPPVAPPAGATYGVRWVPHPAPLPGAASEPVWPPESVEDDAHEDEDVPTESLQSLADSFAPWRDDAWERPQLPRFGPGKPPTDSGERER